MSYPQPAYQPPYGAAPQQTNPLAITALVCGLVSPASWIFAWIPVIGAILTIVAPLSAILAIVFGHIALSQINKRGGAGRGMALAGLIIGYILLGISILIFLVAGLFLGVLFSALVSAA